MTEYLKKSSWCLAQWFIINNTMIGKPGQWPKSAQHLPRPVPGCESFAQNATLATIWRRDHADEFHDAMTELVRSRVDANPAPVGLFVETERGHRDWKAYRLFKEKRRKPRRATGNGPRVIDPRRTVDPEVGSEGVIAQIVTTVIREKRHRATMVHDGIYVGR